jgi:hypothetical protein
MTIDEDRFRNFFLNSSRDPDGIAGIDHVFHKDGEFIASQSRQRVDGTSDRIARTEAALQATGHFDEELISRGMAEGIVDRVEIVEIEEKDTEDRRRMTTRAMRCADLRKARNCRLRARFGTRICSITAIRITPATLASAATRNCSPVSKMPMCCSSSASASARR